MQKYHIVRRKSTGGGCGDLGPFLPLLNTPRFSPTFLATILLPPSILLIVLSAILVHSFLDRRPIDVSSPSPCCHHEAAVFTSTLRSASLGHSLVCATTTGTMPPRPQSSPQPFEPSSAHVALAIALIRAKPAGTSARGECPSLTSQLLLTM